ncbi:MAG: pyrroloquinoline quinone biosynthesis protein PqqB [Gammaproteobacteria bacterium]|nr:pyrroloquinoline quinone biosynthesis protein PqqB [Gammaproteobacteria bacterium]
MKPLVKIAIALCSILFATASLAQTDEAYIYILGVAQDAGYPQIGCYAEHCLPGWVDPSLRRGAASIAVINPNSGQKYLFEATPNLPAQLYALDLEAPNARFQLAGVFLTHAHIGHYAGLMFLGTEAMSAANQPVYAMPRMFSFLENNGPWSQLVENKNIRLEALQDRQGKSFPDIDVTPFLVPHRDEFSETVGYEITGPNKKAVFIPDINKWSVWETNLAELVRSVDYALIDATFYDDGELPGRDMSQIPHPFVSESMEALSELPAEERAKVWFIHFNHTNPLLNTESDESKFLRSQGYNIAAEGVRLPL